MIYQNTWKAKAETKKRLARANQPEDVDQEPCKIGCTRVKRASVRANGKDEYVRGCVHDGDESNRSVPRLASEVTGFTR